MKSLGVFMMVVFFLQGCFTIQKDGYWRDPNMKPIHHRKDSAWVERHSPYLIPRPLYYTDLSMESHRYNTKLEDLDLPMEIPKLVQYCGVHQIYEKVTAVLTKSNEEHSWGYIVEPHDIQFNKNTSRYRFGETTLRDKRLSDKTNE